MTNQPDNWMTIREAALALRVSELTIRRRIKDGRLAHRLINGKYYVAPQEMPGTLEARDELETEELEASSRRSGGPAAVPTQPDQSTAHAGSTEQRDYSPDADPPLLNESIPHDTAAPVVAPGLDLDALLSEHSRLAETAGRARLLEEQLTQLAERHEELRAGMLSLAGRNGWLESKLEERESELRLLTDEQPRASWWRRLFGI
jgi:excisionase family DNA binding protein